MQRLLDEGGYTVVELLTSALLTVLLVGTFGWLIVGSNRHQPRVADRSQQIQEGRVASEKITRELREAYVVNGTPTSSQVSVNTFVRSATCGGVGTLDADEPSIACRVTFNCTGTSCTRTELNPDGSGTPDTDLLVDGLLNATVFSYTPSAADPDHVTVTLTYPSESGGESITVSDGTEMRNDA